MLKRLIILMITALELTAHSSTWADQLANHEQNKFKFSLTSSALDEVKVNLTVLGAQVKDEVFLLTDPNRLVVDLFNKNLKITKTILPSENKFISAIRFGAHPDRLRLVLDLKAEQIDYKTESKKGNLTISLWIKKQDVVTALPDIKETGLIPTPLATQTPTGTIVPLATPTVELTPTSPPMPTSTPTVVVSTAVATAISLETPLPPSSAGDKNITDIKFGKAPADNMPIVILQFSSKSEYKLIKKEDGVYILSVRGTGIESSRLALPFFPPHDFIGFTMVQARNVGADLEITIGVERGVRVASVTKDTQIWIRALNR